MVKMKLQIRLENTYQGKKVFLTGHTGFKGSWLVCWLHLLGANVKGYSLAPPNNNDLFNLIEGESLCTSIIDDIRSKDNICKEIIDFQPDFIFHLAAQPLVLDGYDFPLETFEINVIGTANVLEAARGLKGKCTIIIVTTDKVYQNNEWQYPYRETDPLGGYDPYSSSKACCELVVNSYRNSFFNLEEFANHQKALATARAGNVIGGGDRSKDRIVPDIVKSIESKQTIKVRNPLAIRPWQHVLEPLGGYLLLGAMLSKEPTRFSEAWNFGPFNEDVTSVEDLVKIALEFYGNFSYDLASLKNQPHEARLLRLDISKTISELGWRPKWSAEEAITLSLEWYKRSLSEIPFELVKEQIRLYQ